MNAERLLEHYEKIADAPDAIARLRRFVLDLAVRGKLVPQDQNDEPASELLKRIATEKARLLKAGAIGRQNPLPPLVHEEILFGLPKGWALVRLGDISEFVTSGSRDWAKYYSTNGAIFVRMGNLSKDHYHLRLDQIQRVRPPADGEGTRTRLEAGDILISITGDVGMLGLIPDGFGEAYINQHTAMVRPMPEMKGHYLPELFRSPFAQDQFNEPQRGIKNSFRLTDVTQFVVPLPPLAEQRRIVSKVDELMGLCDRLEAARGNREALRDRLAAASLARLNTPDPEAFQADARFALDALPALTTRPDQIKQLRQTILNLAVRGKLVPQDPNDEPASELLKRIAKEIPASKARDPKAEPPPSNAPRGWVWTHLGRLVAHSDAGWSPKTRDLPRSGDEWGILKVSAVSWDKFRAWENKQVLPGTQPRLQAEVKQGDFLISRANTAELIARAVLVDEPPFKLMMSDKIVRLRLSADINHRFVWIVNNYADFAREHYVRHASGVSPSMKNVSRDVILSLPFPLPPLAEQHRIVAKVDVLMALCDRLETSLTAAADIRRRLLDALLAEALAPVDARELEAAE
jgi:type I restriction enzyme S subunit